MEPSHSDMHQFMDINLASVFQAVVEPADTHGAWRDGIEPAQLQIDETASAPSGISNDPFEVLLNGLR